QGIVRGKDKIREAGTPYVVPSAADRPGRLESVLPGVYLVCNEGDYASAGEPLTRSELSQEAIRLGRLLGSVPPNSETMGLLSLMLLHESRRSARMTPTGDLVLLEDQDRSLWNREHIAEGVALAGRAMTLIRPGELPDVYTVQAAIAAEHARAPR